MSTSHSSGKVSGSGRLARIWRGMIARCYRESCTTYPRYGGRGIRVCQEWMLYPAFEKWSLDNGYDDTLTIDRIQNDGNYHPDNCRWATHEVQLNNTTRNRFMDAFGERKTVSQWSRDRRCKVGRDTLYGRLDAGWDAESALTTPGHPTIHAFGEDKTLSKWVRDHRCKVGRSTLWRRISRYGWDSQRAITTPARVAK